MRKRVYLQSLKTWGIAHRKPLLIILGLSTIGAVVSVAFHVLPAWQVWLAIWGTAVITPIILGLMGKQVGFRWVVLWECILFLPVVLLLVLFIQDVRSYILKGVTK